MAAQRPASMTNPRTLAQMSQRIRLASLVSFYRASRYWMRKGWELKSTRESDYNAFVKANLATNPVAFTKTEASNGACVVYPYRISKGSLAPIQFVETGDNMLSNIYIGDGGGLISAANTIVPTATIGELSALILANNLTPRAGDQLSILGYQQSVDADGTPYVVVNQFEIILDVTDGRLVREYWPIDGDNTMVFVGGDASNLQIGIAKASASGFAMVLSRTEGSITRVSTQSLIVTDTQNYSYYTSAQHVADAAASYGQNTEVFLDSNGIDSPSYNPDITQALLGLELGSGDVGTYYPVGSAGPAGMVSGSTVGLRMVKAPSALYTESNAIVLNYGDAGNVGIASTAVTIQGSRIIFSMPSTKNSPLARVTIAFASGEIVVGEFA